MRAAIVALAALAAGCSRPVGLPPLPDVNTASFLPAVAKRVDEAQAQARARPRDAAANGRLGMVLHAHKLDLSAAAAYKRAALLDPSSFRWSYLHGLTAIGADAVEILRRATSLQPGYLPAQLALGDRALQIGDFALAESAYHAAIRLDATQSRARAGLDRALAAQRKAAPAESRWAGSPPVHDPVLAEVEGMRAGAYFRVANGVSLFQAGRLEEAAAEFEEAVRADPRETAARYNLIRIYGELGRADHAREHYDAAIARGVPSAELFLNYGVVLARNGDRRAAIGLFRQALALNPMLADASANLGYLLDARGDTSAAATLYSRTLESEPNHSGANFRLGRLLLAQGKTSEAARRFERAAETRDENYAPALYGLAAAQRMAGQLDRAQVSFKTALDAAHATGQRSLAEAIAKDLASLRIGRREIGGPK